MHFRVRWSWIILLSADCCLSLLQKVCESISNWFQLISFNLSWLWYCIRLPCVYDFEASYMSDSWLQPHIILYGFSVMIPKQLFCVFQLFAPEVKHFYHKHTWKNSQIIFIYGKWFKTWSNLSKEFASEGVEAAYIAQTIFVIYNYLKSCVWLLLITVSLLVTSASCERNFSKMKLAKTFPRNSMTSERLGNIDIL